MKKGILYILITILLVFCIFALTSCNFEALQGPQGEQGEPGIDGEDGKDGVDGEDGKDGVDGITPLLRINEDTNEWEVSYDKGESWISLGVVATGPQGDKGDTGDKGDKGDKGDTGEQGSPGDAGLSAYELAVKHGFSGTEEEWLESIYKSPEIFVEKYGIFPGNVNIETFEKLLDLASKNQKTLKFNDGEYIFPKTVNIPSNVSLIGCTSTIFKLSADSEATTLMSIGAGVDNVFVSHIIFMGDKASMPTTMGKNIGLLIEGTLRINIENAEFIGFDGYGIYATKISDGKFYKTLQITNCRFNTNYFGMCLGERCEYSQILNCSFGNNYTGCLNQGGNNSYTSCMFNSNYIGFQMDSKNLSNPAHGGCNGCSFNHNTKAIVVNDCKIGWIFSGCQIFYGTIELSECQGVIFDSSIFGSCVLKSTHSSLKNVNLISDSYFQTDSEKILSGNDGSTYINSCLPDKLPTEDYCTVSFYYNLHTNPITKEVKRGEACAAPAEPIKENFTFGGWFADKELSVEYDFSAAVVEDISLYAAWILNEDADLTDESTWKELVYTQAATVATGASVDAYFGVLSCPVQANEHISYVDIVIQRATKEGQEILGVDLWIGDSKTGEIFEHIIVDKTYHTIYSKNLDKYVIRLSIDKKYDFSAFVVVEATRTNGLGIAYGHTEFPCDYMYGKKVAVGDIIKPNGTYIPELVIYSVQKKDN